MRSGLLGKSSCAIAAQANCERTSAVTTSSFWLAMFLLLVVAGIGGMFLYGWRRRKDKMPKVAPLPPDDDWKELLVRGWCDRRAPLQRGLRQDRRRPGGSV